MLVLGVRGRGKSRIRGESRERFGLRAPANSGTKSMGEETFNVVLRYADGTHEYLARWLSGEDAVLLAKHYSDKPAARAGLVREVFITDGGDSTVFLWRHGEGVVFPPRGADGRFINEGSD